MRPLAWTIHHFDEEETYGLKLSTRQLQDDVELQGFVRRAVWDLPAVMPMVILPRLPHLHSLQVNAEVGWDPVHVGVTGVLSALPALRRLALHEFDSTADSSFSFASSAPSIRHLDLIDCDAFEVEGGELLEELCTNSSIPAVMSFCRLSALLTCLLTEIMIVSSMP